MHFNFAIAIYIIGEGHPGVLVLVGNLVISCSHWTVAINNTLENNLVDLKFHHNSIWALTRPPLQMFYLGCFPPLLLNDLLSRSRKALPQSTNRGCRSGEAGSLPHLTLQSSGQVNHSQVPGIPKIEKGPQSRGQRGWRWAVMTGTTGTAYDKGLDSAEGAQHRRLDQPALTVW